MSGQLVVELASILIHKEERHGPDFALNTDEETIEQDTGKDAEYFKEEVADSLFEESEIQPMEYDPAMKETIKVIAQHGLSPRGFKTTKMKQKGVQNKPPEGFQC